jgi:hypothetical protein
MIDLKKRRLRLDMGCIAVEEEVSNRFRLYISGAVCVYISMLGSLLRQQ